MLNLRCMPYVLSVSVIWYNIGALRGFHTGPCVELRSDYADRTQPYADCTQPYATVRGGTRMGTRDERKKLNMFNFFRVPSA